MSEPVPIDEFGWIKEDVATSWSTSDVMALNPDGKHSYILEVDLEIPEEIHNQTSDYPLCPEKLEITKDMVSPKSWSVIKVLPLP